MGKETSQHCGGCHDMPLMVDGLMTGSAPIPAADLRAHSGVTCRLCHGIEAVSKDGNASYTWSRVPLPFQPVLGDADVDRQAQAAQVIGEERSAPSCASAVIVSAGSCRRTWACRCT